LCASRAALGQMIMRSCMLCHASFLCSPCEDTCTHCIASQLHKGCSLLYGVCTAVALHLNQNQSANNECWCRVSYTCLLAANHACQQKSSPCKQSVLKLAGGALIIGKAQEHVRHSWCLPHTGDHDIYSIKRIESEDSKTCRCCGAPLDMRHDRTVHRDESLSECGD
jgi:hypothetical protein